MLVQPSSEAEFSRTSARRPETCSAFMPPSTTPTSLSLKRSEGFFSFWAASAENAKSRHSAHAHRGDFIGGFLAIKE